MRKYVKPILRTEEFVPQEYCKYCGTNTKYLFKCDAGKGVRGDVFWDRNNNHRLDKYDKNLTKGEGHYFHACSKSHEALTTDDFLNGFYIPNGGNDERRGYLPIRVIIWRGEDGDNVHATTKLDINQWETAKS